MSNPTINESAQMFQEKIDIMAETFNEAIEELVTSIVKRVVDYMDHKTDCTRRLIDANLCTCGLEELLEMLPDPRENEGPTL